VTSGLHDLVAGELAAPQSPEVVDFAAALARSVPGAAAVLFYGSALRARDLDGVLDFYVLTDRPHLEGWRALANRMLPPEVGYREQAAGPRILRAKVATMTMAQFREAASGQTLDTSVWARFVQPAALVWARDEAAAEGTRTAVAEAAMTAASFAMALGPPRGTANDFWTALFRQTYAAEFRVEAAGREQSILSAAPERYAALAPLAWRAAGLPFRTDEEVLIPELSPERRRVLKRRWALRRALGKPLNLARIGKAAFTFEGAARYAAWKIERHTGIAIEVTPWRERHPLLAAPIAAWQLWRGRRS
jgi:hypothetical protein